MRRKAEKRNDMPIETGLERTGRERERDECLNWQRQDSGRPGEVSGKAPFGQVTV